MDKDLENLSKYRRMRETQYLFHKGLTDYMNRKVDHEIARRQEAQELEDEGNYKIQAEQADRQIEKAIKFTAKEFLKNTFR